MKIKERSPLCHTHINYFVRQVKSIGKAKFALDDLQDVFPHSIVWQKDDLYEEDSECRIFFASLPNSELDQIDINDLLALGLIWCRGDYYNKAEVLYELLQPPEQTSSANV